MTLAHGIKRWAFNRQHLPATLYASKLLYDTLSLTRAVGIKVDVKHSQRESVAVLLMKWAQFCKIMLSQGESNYAGSRANIQVRSGTYEHNSMTQLRRLERYMLKSAWRKTFTPRTIIGTYKQVKIWTFPFSIYSADELRNVIHHTNCMKTYLSSITSSGEGSISCIYLQLGAYQQTCMTYFSGLERCVLNSW